MHWREGRGDSGGELRVAHCYGFGVGLVGGGVPGVDLGELRGDGGRDPRGVGGVEPNMGVDRAMRVVIVMRVFGMLRLGVAVFVVSLFGVLVPEGTGLPLGPDLYQGLMQNLAGELAGCLQG